ncbi:MAG: hypothetical protein RLZZ186_1012 [Cyanobacteriota bacterium]
MPPGGNAFENGDRPSGLSIATHANLKKSLGSLHSMLLRPCLRVSLSTIGRLSKIS